MRRAYLPTLLILLVLAGSLSARTWYVKPDGTGDAPTIQAGIDSAAIGDTVMVAAGTYTEDCKETDYNECPPFDPGPAMLVLRAGIVLCGESGPEGTILDAYGACRVMYCRELTEMTSIEGFTIRGGYASTDTDGHGGALYSLNSPIRFRNVVFANNRSHKVNGGAVFCRSGDLDIVDASFVGNEARNQGGGLCCWGSVVTVVNTEFIANVSHWNGGGMYHTGGSLTLSDAEFVGNETMYAGGGMVVSLGGPHIISNVVFADNIAHSGGGGMLCMGTATLTNVTFADNVGFIGGGIWCEHESAPVLRNCTFYGNGEEYCYGASVACWGNAAPIIDKTVIAYSLYGEAVYCHDAIGNPMLSCCNVFGNPGGDWVGCIADQYGINGNFSACPSFCYADGGDLHLCDESPCLPGNHPDGYECGLIGAWGQGCSCGPTSAQPSTWGTIKAMYR